MGVAISRYSELASNELLMKFCSAEIISPNDPFWNQMLSFNINPPSTAQEQLIFDASTEPLLNKFLQNNLQTGNLGSLLQVFITRASILLASPNSDNVMLAWQTYNALFVVRAVSKYLVEMVAEHELCRHLDEQPLARTRRAPEEAPVTPQEGQDSGANPEAPPSPATEADASPKLLPESRVEMVIDALISLIIDVPVTDNTYYLHLECINTILVLMSVYMFAGMHEQSRLIENSLIYRTLFQGRYSMHAPLLVKTLVNNLCTMLPVPPTMFGARTEGGSILIDLASGFWNMLTFTSPVQRTIYTQPPTDRETLLERLKSEHPAANQSCLLLLALANHCIRSDNLYRSALLSVRDTADNSSTTSSKDSACEEVQPPRIEMAALHKYLCATAGCEHSTLLLYLMLHSCKTYKKYVSTVPNIENLLSKNKEVNKDDNSDQDNTHSVHDNNQQIIEQNEDNKGLSFDIDHEFRNIEEIRPQTHIVCLQEDKSRDIEPNAESIKLSYKIDNEFGNNEELRQETNVVYLQIVPILQVLYDANLNNSHQIYMSLIVLLILTEDEALIKNVHTIMLKNLQWYTERTISEISLGGLMVLVIVRVLQHNMAWLRDKYLHTNCAAAIANMSCEFRNLHPYVAQRLVSLFETLTKRRTRLLSQIEGGDINNIELPHHAEEKTEEIMDHIAVLDEVLRMLLEIINSCLTHQLSNNLNVVYALLHKRQLFHEHRNLPIAQNIEMVIGYFSSRLQRVQEGAGTELGVTEVLQTIKKGAEQWSTDRLKKFPDLKFRYVEEDRPEDFFTPYVWALNGTYGTVHWASEGGTRALQHLLNINMM